MGQRGSGGRHSGTEGAWAALGGDPALTERIAYAGPPGLLPAGLPVMSLARATVAVCALAAAELTARRNGGPLPAVRVDDGAVATAFVSERHLRIDGRAPSSFAPLSRFWRTADGWVRTHANYPHHRARLLRALDLPASAGPPDVGAALAGRRAAETEETVHAAGGLAVAACTPGEWAAHPQGAVVAARPLLTRTLVDAGGRPRTLPPLAGQAALPAAGLPGSPPGGTTARGAAGEASTAWYRWPPGSPPSKRTRALHPRTRKRAAAERSAAARPERCPPRRWTTARAICWPPRCSAH